MTQGSRGLEQIVADALELIAKELDSQRGEIRNANAPVLVKLSGIEALLREHLKDRVHDREDDARFRASVADRFTKLLGKKA